jgi:hypothetical protein
MNTSNYRGQMVGTLQLIYSPGCPPVLWAESPNDIPAWDWTRSDLSPFEARIKTPEEAKLGYSEIVRNLDGEDPKPRRRAEATWGYPRLVREHPGHRHYKLFRGSVLNTIAGLWKYASQPNWDKPKSKFRQRILKIVPEIGLLRPSDDAPIKYGANFEADTLSAWRERSLDFFIRREFINYLEDHKTDFPLETQFWDQFREEKAKTTKFQPPHEFQGFWMTPETELGQRWFQESSKWEGVFQRWERDSTQPTKAFKANPVQNVKEARALMRLEYMKEFLGFARGAIELELSPDGSKFDAKYKGGSWGWSLYELTQLCDAKDLRYCKCGNWFPSDHGNDVYCSTKCSERFKKRRNRNRKRLESVAIFDQL